MKLTLKRGELKDAICGFSKIVNGKSQNLPILAGIRFEASKKAILAQSSDLDQQATYCFEAAEADGDGVFIIPLAAIKELAKGADGDLVIFETGTDCVEIENHVGDHVLRQTATALPPEDWPPCRDAMSTQAAPGFLEIYRKLAPFASVDGTRRMLISVCIDKNVPGKTVMITTDGRRLSRVAIVMPVKKTCVIPVTKFLQWTGLGANEGLGVDRKNTWFVLHAGSWRYQVKLVDGVYPNWRQCVPNAEDVKPCFTIADNDIPVLQSLVRQLPPNAETVTLGASADKKVIARGGKESRIMSLELTGSRYEGLHDACVNGAYLLDAIACGFRDFRDACAGGPLYAETGDAVHVLMPMRTSADAPTPPSAPETQQPAANEAAQTPVAPEEPGAPPQENTKMPDKNESKAEPTALEKLQVAYEAAKTKVHEANQSLGDVAVALKEAVKEDRARRSEVATVRAGLQKLQAINI